MQRRVLFTGSRDWTDEAPVRKVIDALPSDAIIIHGACKTGLDEIADRLAAARGLDHERYPANWTRHGKAAGPIRNQRMIDEGKPTEVHAFPLKNSTGTIDCAVRCARAGVPGMAHGPFAHRVREAVRADEASRLRAWADCGPTAEDCARMPDPMPVAG